MKRRVKAFVGAALLAVVGSAAWAAPSGLSIEPARVELAGPRATHQVVVTAAGPGGASRDVTGQVSYTVLPAGLVRVKPNGELEALRDGSGTLRAVWRESKTVQRQAMVPLTVRSSRERRAISFRNEVVPVLTQAGCNQGICHGAQFGRGGFRLSLLGYDEEADHDAIAREGGGRRIQLSRPEESLLLRKAIAAVPHAGGMRVRPGSRHYQILSDWLAEGAPGRVAKERQLTGIQVVPPTTILGKTGRQQFRVVGSFSDGTTEDVTIASRFNTNNEGIASVDERGVAAGAGPGETAIMVRYQNLVTIARVTVPFAVRNPNAQRPSPNASLGFVDTEIRKAWSRLGLAPSASASDSDFARRVYLDLIGTLPTPEELDAFLAECAAERQASGAGKAPGSRTTSSGTSTKARAKLIERLLQRPEWVDYWTLYFGDILRNNREIVGEKGMWAFRAWIQESLRNDKPYNRMVRELTDVSGSTYRNPASNYYSVVRTPEDLAETTSQVLLGIRIQCARCHNHPFEKWSQNDYYQFAAYFARVRYKGFPGIGDFGGDQLVLIADSGDVKHPKTGQAMTPKPLEGKAVEADGRKRLSELAAWLADPANPYVAQNVVNRVWARLMGRGLIHPVDDVRSSNPASHPELLDALVKDFAAGGFNLRKLMQRIVSSEAYQLSSAPTRANAVDSQFYSRYFLRRIPSEPLLDAICALTGVPERFANLPKGTRAISLPDSQVKSYFLETFGRPLRVAVCECERESEPNVTQSLHLANGSPLQSKLEVENNRLGQLLRAGKSDREIIEQLYRVAYARLPSPTERDLVMREIAAAGTGEKERRRVLEDVMWTLINSKEFLFNH